MVNINVLFADHLFLQLSVAAKPGKELNCQGRKLSGSSDSLGVNPACPLYQYVPAAMNAAQWFDWPFEPNTLPGH
jgi:hypothetical protein